MRIEIVVSEYSGRWSADAALKPSNGYGYAIEDIHVKGVGRNKSIAVRRAMEQICDELEEIDKEKANG